VRVILSQIVEVKRRYDSSRRDALTRATKAEVVAAARELFVAQGYPYTTVAQIAEASRTPQSSVYRLFGSKRGILKEVLDVSLGGDDEPVGFQHRPEVQDAFAAPDPGAMLDAFARIVRGVLHRSANLQAVLADSAAVDPEAAEMLEITRGQRHVGQSRIVRALAKGGHLRPGLRPADATDIVYTLMSPEVFRCLTVERGWSEAAYQRWLSETLRTQLLG
jgi:AcrR family transcriptional regulator